MTDEEKARLTELEDSLRLALTQIAALTRRVYQLETGKSLPAAEVTPEPARPMEPPAPRPDWESTVGTNWLNRIGVVLLVIGITLFLSYAMTYLGPAGKIAIGVTAGAALLAAGYWYEHKGDFRPFSLAMLAGGFAVLYTTAYAAYAIEASRVIDNLAIGIVIQAAIALAAVWQAVQFDNERAAGLGLFCAYLSLANSDSPAVVYAGCYPLTLGGLWLSERLKWKNLPWAVIAYTWFSEMELNGRDWEFEYKGHPMAWVNLLGFAAFEIRERLREASLKNPVWICVNAVFFLTVTFTSSRFTSDHHASNVFGLLAVTALVTSAIRYWLNVRNEAASEALALVAAALWAGGEFADSDSLLALMLVLAFTMTALVWQRQASAIALAITGEAVLGLATVAGYILFFDSKLTMTEPLRIHLALPQTLLLIACLFTAGRWLTITPWPSGAALVGVAIVTLATIPKTMGTIVLAIEAIIAISAGLYLARRPIRLGGIALFLFSVLKVFFYDLSELDTLARIFSFIVLGLLLIGASWAYTKYRKQLQEYL